MKFSSVALLSISSIVATSAMASDRVEIKHDKNPMYVWDSYGEIVRDGFGGCVRTIYWKEDIEACGGKPKMKPVAMAPKPVAAPAPKPAPVKAQPKPVAAPAPVVAPVVAAPVVVPVVAPAPAPAKKPAVVVEVDKPAAFSGLFENNSFDLKIEAQDKLDAYADYMKAKPNTNIQVNGYTDDRGRASYNQMLSEKRANAVKSYLQDQGIASNRITAKGMGESSPIATNATKAGRAENRRVELIVK